MPLNISSSRQNLVFLILSFQLDIVPYTSSHPKCLQCKAMNTDPILFRASELAGILFSVI